MSLDLVLKLLDSTLEGMLNSFEKSFMISSLVISS